jgi:hypothetical protein
MFWTRTNRISDEELDWAIRAALRVETEGLQPSPEAWQRVRARIENPAAVAARRRRPVQWQHRAASLLQGAVLAVVVVGLGVTVNQRSRGGDLAYPVAPDVVYVARARATLPKDDMLSMGRMVHMAQEPTQPGGRCVPE